MESGFSSECQCSIICNYCFNSLVSWACVALCIENENMPRVTHGIDSNRWSWPYKAMEVVIQSMLQEPSMTDEHTKEFIRVNIQMQLYDNKNVFLVALNAIWKHGLATLSLHKLRLGDCFLYDFIKMVLIFMIQLFFNQLPLDL